jgi:hypothetical protein
MPISLTCPGCQRKLAVPDSAAGKTVKCPKCETTTRVPAVEPSEIAAIVDDEPEAIGAAARPPAPRHDLDERPQRRGRLDDDVEDVQQTPRRRARPQELEELEEDEQRERARQTKKGMGTGAVVVGIISAFITLLAFAGLGVGAWLSTQLFANKMDQSTGQLWRQVCVYSACGLVVLGFILSLYSRSILRILALLFAVIGAGAATLGMLAITGIVTNPFEDYSKGRTADGGSGSHPGSASGTSSVGTGPKLEVGATYTVHVVGIGSQEVVGFKDVSDIDKFQKAMRDAMGGGGGGDRGRGPGRGSFPPDGGPGPGRGARGSGGGPGGGPGKPDMAEMKKVIDKLKQEHVLVEIPEGTKVKLLKDDAHPQVQVLEGDLKDEKLYLLSSSFLKKE